MGLIGSGMVLGAIGFAYLSAGEIYNYKDSVEGTSLPEADAIVCLAGGRGRIAAAGDLWYRYWVQAQGPAGSAQSKVPILYFSGVGHQVTWHVVSKQLKKPVSQAIRQSEVIIENESSNTYANARWVARYAQERHWRKIILMTSSYHMKRAQLIFDEVLKREETPIEIETFSVYQEPFARREWRNGPNGVRVTLIEYLKWVYYRSVWKTF
jgi:uncharacterized SAM-binding protein YcdF (DUF218 family)